MSINDGMFTTFVLFNFIHFLHNNYITFLLDDISDVITTPCTCQIFYNTGTFIFFLTNYDMKFYSRVLLVQNYFFLDRNHY